jgi:NAD(P)-dependent dehydrogenase (short-subunit alcohol dehydrogenase family)
VAQEVVGSGGGDVVLNNAGSGLAGALEGLTDEQILRIVNTNMLGTIRTTKAFIPHFRQKEQDCSSIRDLDWRRDDSAFQLHLSRHEMGA